MRIDHKHDMPGILIVVEGTDGSGKSTQLRLLQNYLEGEGYGVVFTEWNSSKLISKTIKKAKKQNKLNPLTFSILHATDFADRLENTIIPALKSGMIVLADRYIYTALARDVARGVDSRWVRSMYGFAVRPDKVFYYRVPVEISLQRIAATRPPKFYEAGMDLKLSDDPFESYILFQSRVIEEYEKMIEEFGMIVMDGTEPIHEQQTQFRQYIHPLLDEKFGGFSIRDPKKG
ncbi:MAG: dTMP kinase [bacterium]